MYVLVVGTKAENTNVLNGTEIQPREYCPALLFIPKPLHSFLVLRKIRRTCRKSCVSREFHFLSCESCPAYLAKKNPVHVLRISSHVCPAYFAGSIPCPAYPFLRISDRVRKLCLLLLVGWGAPDPDRAEIVGFGCFIRYFCTFLAYYDAFRLFLNHFEPQEASKWLQIDQISSERKIPDQIPKSVTARIHQSSALRFDIRFGTSLGG